MTECVFLYSSFVWFCVRSRLAVGNHVSIRIFQDGFPYFKYCFGTNSAYLQKVLARFLPTSRIGWAFRWIFAGFRLKLAKSHRQEKCESLKHRNALLLS